MDLSVKYESPIRFCTQQTTQTHAEDATDGTDMTSALERIAGLSMPLICPWHLSATAEIAKTQKRTQKGDTFQIETYSVKLSQVQSALGAKSLHLLSY